jgi:muramidase (phage lysozyme)
VASRPLSTRSGASGNASISQGRGGGAASTAYELGEGGGMYGGFSQVDTLTVVATSGETGWVNVETREGQRGWVFGKYVVVADMSGETCAPSRGQGVVGRYQKALHDAIAFAEGTRNHSKDGYDVMFSFVLATSCVQHPNQCHDFGNTCSTAAGRYQFLKKTWDATARARGLTTFGQRCEPAIRYECALSSSVRLPQGQRRDHALRQVLVRSRPLHRRACTPAETDEGCGAHGCDQSVHVRTATGSGIQSINWSEERPHAGVPDHW